MNYTNPLKKVTIEEIEAYIEREFAYLLALAAIARIRR